MQAICDWSCDSRAQISCFLRELWRLGTVSTKVTSCNCVIWVGEIEMSTREAGETKGGFWGFFQRIPQLSPFRGFGDPNYVYTKFVDISISRHGFLQEGISPELCATWLSRGKKGAISEHFLFIFLCLGHKSAGTKTRAQPWYRRKSGKSPGQFLETLEFVVFWKGLVSRIRLVVLVVSSVKNEPSLF